MEFTTEGNNAKVILNAAPFMDAVKLKSVVQRALMGQGLNFSDLKEEKILDIVLALDSSEEVYDALFKCLVKSSYNGIKITPETFENEGARGDFYEVAFYCLKVNLYPFFKNLLTKFGIHLEEMTGEVLKSK